MKIIFKIFIFMGLFLLLLQVDYCISVNKKEVRVGYVDTQDIYNIDITWDNISFLLNDANDINLINKNLNKLQRKYNIQIKNYSTTKINVKFSYDKEDIGKNYFDKNNFAININCEEKVSFCEEIDASNKERNQMGNIIINID